MPHKLKTETFSQKIEHSGGVILLSLTPLFSFVTCHLKHMSQAMRKCVLCHMQGADQPAPPRSLISAFVVHCLDSMISLDSIAEISRL